MPREVAVALALEQGWRGLRQRTGDVGQVQVAVGVRRGGESQVVRQLVGTVAPGFRLQFDDPHAVIRQDRPVRPAVRRFLLELGQQVLIDEHFCRHRRSIPDVRTMSGFVQEFEEPSPRSAW